jgi:hypothetical protein
MNKPIATLAAFLLLSCNAYASQVRWEFDNVVFSDGATVTGGFTMSDLGPNILFGDFDVTMSGGNLAGTTYTYSLQTGGWDDPGDGLYILRLLQSNPGLANQTGLRVFEFAVSGDIYSAGTIALQPSIDYYPFFTPSPGLAYAYNREAFCGNSTCTITNVIPSYGGETGRTLVSGSIMGTVTAVPVPTAAWLFGSALTGLGWLRRRTA